MTTKNGIFEFLIDTGSNKNFCSPQLSAGSIPLSKPLVVNTAGGRIEINKKIVGKFFLDYGILDSLTFYVLPGLNSFDGIIGDDSLKELEAVVDRKEDVLLIRDTIRIPLKAKISCNLNYILSESMPLETKERIDEMISRYKNLFGPLDDGQAAMTNVQAEIRTTTTEPVYSKSYPYPAAMRDEVEKQIGELLSEGIIRPSKSPYNSPIWVVPKKPKPNGEKRYRLVVDYKRLNAVTVPDTYPIPDINATLASMGDAKFFTTIDLTSGFHQIPMKPSDIPKTAFSTMNGKFEFLRLPFGLKNAPAIFQRMIDDVLKEFIGRICYVYIDDIIVFGRSEEETLRNVDTIFKRLEEANLKVNIEKTHFMQKEVEFLGYIVGSEGIKPDPKKVEAIEKLLPPTNLKELKGFLGMTSYYRRFIKDYAKVAKPLTNLTRGENAQVKASQSKKVLIELDNEALLAFQKLKSLLTTAEILAFPEFDKPFNLTTDASNYAIGAVLSQGEIGKDKPIAYISRSLNKTEEGYATNEKEMLAIVWALDNLRNYLYGAKKIKIYTDHQPLTYALGNRNYNAKLKRWKARIEEYNHELIYKPGRSNYVADALSRLRTSVNHISDESTVTASEVDSQATRTASEADGNDSQITRTASETREDDVFSTGSTIHSATQDASDLIPHMEVPINVFKNQIIIKIGIELQSSETPHNNFHRHYFSSPEWNAEKLLDILKKTLHPNVVNGIKAPENCLPVIQDLYLQHFSRYKIRIAQRIVTDVNSANLQFEIIQKEHRRAHRNARENKKQILEEYYFPRMYALIRKFVANCEVCNTNKYDRNPNKPEIQETPSPTSPCEILHMDIMEIQDQKFISVIDKFSKFAKLFHISDRSVLNIREKLVKILHYFTAPKILVSDNESSFISPLIKDFLERLGVKIYLTPSQRSEVNGQVERLHSTLIEIYRCLRAEKPELSVQELMYVSVDRYNNTIHSVTGRRPSDIFFNRIRTSDFNKLLEARSKINRDLRKLIRKNVKERNTRMNRKRFSPKKYKKGDVIYVRIKNIKSKNKAVYRKEIVDRDNKVTVRTASGKRIHKAHIKNLNQN